MRQQNNDTNCNTPVHIEFDNGEFHLATVKIVIKARKCWCTDKTGVTFREQNNHTVPVGVFMLL